jgi:hypothetical protein
VLPSPLFWLGGASIDLQIHHQLNQRRSIAFYHNAREAFHRTAELRGAEDSQFMPAYTKAYEAVSELNSFNGRNAFSVPYKKTSEAALRNLCGCLTGLAILRSPTSSQETKSRYEREIEPCDADEAPGDPSDPK